MAAQITAAEYPVKVKQIALPDGHLISGTNKEVFAHYHMDAKGIAETVKKTLTEE